MPASSLEIASEKNRLPAPGLKSDPGKMTAAMWMKYASCSLWIDVVAAK
jgi:hypothetical protein